MRTRIFLQILILLILSTPVAGFGQPVVSSISPGLNITALPATLVAAHQTAFPLLAVWKSSGITAIETYDAGSGKMLRAQLDVGGTPAGIDFQLIENSALHVYAQSATLLSLGDNISCSPLNIATGLNLVSYACFPSAYPASTLISSIGTANITSISKLDPQSGRWQTTAVDNGTIVGEDFPLLPGEGYIIHSSVAVSGWNPPQLLLTPATLSVQQGQPGTSLTVTLPAAAPPGGSIIDLASSDPTLTTVPSQITIAQGQTTASIPLTLPDTNSSTIQTVTVTASRPGLFSAQTVLSVKPKPTINLSPLSTLTGLTFTYLLTVNLSDVAPTGGFPVTLTASPANIVSAPTSVIVPAGSSSTQVSVTATTVGNAVINASSPGRGFSGAQNNVTVTPIQTMNYGPLSSAQLGIMVSRPAAATTKNTTYGPAVSTQVGVVVGSTISGVVPPTGAIGSTGLKVAVTGSGLSSATAISFQPATGITIQPGSFAINASGNPEVTVDIDPAAPTVYRTVVVTLPSGSAMPATPGANQFRVTLPEPVILSMQPIRAMTGQTVSLNIFGKNLSQASSVSFIPGDGISVSNPPTINATGNMATLSVNIAANAPLGNRTVTVTTPGWTSSATPTVANTFTITADSGTTYTPLISSEIGVMVTTPSPANSLNVPYGPVISNQIGVVVGSALKGVIPSSGAIGSTGLKVTLTGSGLDTATAVAFQPPTGITIQTGSFAINASGNPEVTINIDPTAPTIMRTVIATLPTGFAPPAAPGANQFRVTLPEPQILSLQPLRSMVGQTVSLSIYGKNLTQASSINFTPADGISVNNPPVVNAAGDMATVTLSIAANAPLGDRTVTISTPGWTSSPTPSVGNTFSITADAGTTYAPLISSEIGVMVATPPAANSIIVPYGPMTTTAVGVLVTPTTPPATQNINYGPVVSTQIGIAIGGTLKAIAPLAVEPGSTTTVTVTGTGLDLVTAIKVIPDTGITIGSWTPAADGLTGTVVITADAITTPVGMKTIVPLTVSGAITPAGPSSNGLLVGYKPSLNSISPILPTVGTSFTLTINGVHLQGATNVEILPANNVTIANPPIWVSDGTGEHLTITVIIDSNAVPGDRVVVVTTPYGVTTTVASPANTITFFKPGVALLRPSDEMRLVAATSELYHKPARIQSEFQERLAIINTQRAKTGISPPPAATEITLSQLLLTQQIQTDKTVPSVSRYLYAGYRGPPTILPTRRTYIPGGYHA